MKRLTTKGIAFALVLLLSTSAVAFAGTFEGEGVDDPRVGISFKKKNRVIKRFSVEKARFFCSNGEAFRAGMRAGDMRLNRRNRFEGRFTDSAGKVAFRVEGRVARREARGTTRIVAYVDSYKCSTPLVEWQARAAIN